MGGDLTSENFVIICLGNSLSLIQGKAIIQCGLTRLSYLFNGNSYTDKACWYWYWHVDIDGSVHFSYCSLALSPRYWNGPMYLVIGLNCSGCSIVDGGPFISFSFIVPANMIAWHLEGTPSMLLLLASLTLKRLGNFFLKMWFQFLMLFNSFIWNWSNTMNV